MQPFVFARFVLPAAILVACSATAPLPEQPATGGSGGDPAGRGGSAGTRAGTGGAGGTGAAGKGAASAGTSGGGGDEASAGASSGEAGSAGKASGGAAGKASGGAAGKGLSGGAGGPNEAGAGGEAGTGGSSSGSGGQAGSGDPFGGGGSDGGAGGAESCALEKVAPGDGLSCTSINYITTGDACLGCDRGPSLYFCEGASTPPSPGCTTLPSSGAGYFCCDKSVCTPQPGGCDNDVRYHCPPDATVPSACKKLGGDPTSYCCPK